MKILIVNGGGRTIPPKGWGGVENQIWQQWQWLEQNGHSVTVMNRRGRKVIPLYLAKPWEYDIVHLHEFRRAGLWAKLAKWWNFRLLVTTHHGYAAFPDRWDARYQGIFKGLLEAPHLIALTPEIQQTFADYGRTRNVYRLPNGIQVSDMKYAPQAKEKAALVLGKIEERKKQAWIADVLKGVPVRCDLIGPLSSGYENFNGNGENVRYIGPWTRDTVWSQLTDYSCMILLSDGEAHAGVVLEAMAAGLSLVVSEEASHNLDRSRPWVKVVEREPAAFAAAVKTAVEENERYRAEIRAFCTEQFDWSAIMPRYLKIIEEIKRTG